MFKFLTKRPSASIKDHLSPLPDIAARDRQVHDLIVEGRETTRAYFGSPLPAEKFGHDARTKSARKLVRQAYLRGLGRRLALPEMLLIKNAHGHPLWTVRDPMTKHAGHVRGNEVYCGGNDLPPKPQPSFEEQMDAIRRRSTMLVWSVSVSPNRARDNVQWTGLIKLPRAFDETTVHYPVGGIPPIPARAREIVTDPAIRRRASLIGILYQPLEWEGQPIPKRPDPDPAIVVEWKDLPGEYYCLALWGDDKHAIEEWLD